MIYKVSYVIIGGDRRGAVINQDHAPEIGAQVEIGDQLCEIVEVQELVPPMGDFAYLHVTCRPIAQPPADRQDA
ncbi:MAG TPA: hypothetical protein PLJ78_09840 [Anaerolineae bacterium]|nr:hypothetical protein [Anaerolineae bacterium]HQK14229.1 hypothetical protein [Anaerolineae bacterium]